MLAQWWGRYPHEPEFALFRHLASVAGLVLDVGAHRGQSAVSVLRQTQRLRVHSVEPNPGARRSLRWLRCLHPMRFTHSPVAAGARDGQATLWIPGAKGSGLSTQASLDPEEYDRPLVKERLAADGFDASARDGFRQVRVRMRRLDDLLASRGLRPDLVKLDVEGHEADVLAGLAQTLRQMRPALLIEVNAPDRWWPSLELQGYRAFRFCATDERLTPCSDFAGVLNLWALHPASESALHRALWHRIQATSP